MKHVKNKFLSEVQISTQLVEVLNNIEPTTSHSTVDMDEFTAYGMTDADELITMFTLKDGRNIYRIPEPDFVICLFEAGRQNVIKIPQLRKKLLSELENTHSTVLNTNNFFATCSLGSQSLMNAMEAFINRIIPEDYKYESTTTKATIIQNKQQIERNSSFEVKIKQIVPDAIGKNFHIEFPDLYTSIFDLKNVRDDMTHLKSFRKSKAPLSYESVFNKAFKMDYLKALNAVKSYINFYSENLIEPCPCDKDF